VERAVEEETAIAPDPAGDRCPSCGQPVGDAWMVCAWCGEQLAAPAELPVGATLHDGRYQILGVLGRGGFGITYEAGDQRLMRRVAIKELFPDSAVRHGSVVLTPPHARAAFREARERFQREARVLARFTHPGIVRVYEVFEEHGTAYLVMEHLDGRTLVDVLLERGRPFSEDEVLDVAARVAAALRPVHAAGVLHRDLNPANVVLTATGRIVLIDFGLARDFDLDRTVGMTRVVTPGYAPIEQYRGEGRFGPFTDVYGLAATCYRLATGKVPTAALARDAGAELPAPHRLNPAISKAVSDGILDGLELDPAHRPQDLDALLARLGIRRLPETPRSILLDAAGLRPPETDEPPPGDEPAPSPPAPSPAAAPAPSPAPAPAPAEPVGAADGTVAWVPPDATVPAGAGTVPLGDLTAVVPPTGPAAAVPAPAPAPAAMLPPSPAGRRPLTSAAGHPGASGLPVAVGPHRPGRPKVTVPLLAVAVAVGMAAPVVGAALAVLVALPALATLGDSTAHRLRLEHGVEGGWAERHLSPGALSPVRFVRNAAISVVRASPVIGVGTVLLAGWYALAETSAPAGLVDWSLRLIGGATVTGILLAGREGSARFRTGLGLDELVLRWVPDGRTNERVVVGWLVVAMVVAGALLLTPDPFPLP
jgi:serine/threonine-protein kinase